MALVFSDHFTTSALDTAKWDANLYSTQPTYSEWDGSTNYKQMGRGGGARVPLKMAASQRFLARGATVTWSGTIGHSTVSQHAYYVYNSTATRYAMFEASWAYKANITIGKVHLFSSANTTSFNNVGDTNTYYEFKIAVLSNGNVEFYRDNVLQRTDTNVFTADDEIYFQSPNNHDNGSVSYLDWIEVDMPASTNTTAFFAMM